MPFIRIGNQLDAIDITYTRSVFQPIKKWVQQDPMEMFTHDVKNIKDTANKNGLKNAMCKQSLTEKNYRFLKCKCSLCRRRDIWLYLYTYVLVVNFPRLSGFKGD